MRPVTDRCPASQLRELLTLDELTDRVGMSVRNMRFYTTQGLVPPPIRRGRSGYYSADHVARLELVRSCRPRVHAVGDREVRRPHPGRRATPRTSPCTARCSRRGRPSCRRAVAQGELDRRAGRTLTDDDLARSTRWASSSRPSRAASRSPSRTCRSAWRCSTSASRWRPRRPRRRSSPRTAARSPRSSTSCSARKVWPAYKESGAPPDQLREVVERLKPLSVASLVTAYEVAMDEAKRGGDRAAHRPLILAS